MFNRKLKIDLVGLERQVRRLECEVRGHRYKFKEIKKERFWVPDSRGVYNRHAYDWALTLKCVHCGHNFFDRATKSQVKAAEKLHLI